MLEKILSFLVTSSLVIGVVRRYLALNKLWVRRKERAVAESISIVALLLAMATSAPFLAKNALRGDARGTLNELIWVVSNVFMLLVGVGVWVPGRRLGLWGRLAAALRLERDDTRALLRGVMPRDTGLIVKILHQVATVDEHLDERERSYVQGFADTWGVTYRVEAGGRGGEGGYVALRQSLTEYLATAPPPAQVEQLRGVIEALVKIDQKISTEEELALSEIFGLLDHYTTGEQASRHRVAIVPQSREQERAIVELVPGARKVRHSGGDVFVLESYFSEPYAEIMCKKYRALSLLTLVLPDDGAAPGGG